MDENLEETCNRLRNDIKGGADNVKELMRHNVFYNTEDYDGQHSEMSANIMLAYRHLEDARMRVGKILQAAGDGVSILDKK
jgi:hypothetical protein